MTFLAAFFVDKSSFMASALRGLSDIPSRATLEDQIEGKEGRAISTKKVSRAFLSRKKQGSCWLFTDWPKLIKLLLKDILKVEFKDPFKPSGGRSLTFQLFNMHVIRHVWGLFNEQGLEQDLEHSQALLWGVQYGSPATQGEHSNK